MGMSSREDVGRRQLRISHFQSGWSVDLHPAKDIFRLVRLDSIGPVAHIGPTKA